MEASLQPDPHPQHALGHVFLQFVSTTRHTHTHIHDGHTDTHVGVNEIPHPCKNDTHTQTNTNSFHGLRVTTDAGKVCKACPKSPTPPTHTHPSLSKQAASCQPKRVSLHQFLCPAILFFCPSVPPSKDSSPLCIPPPSHRPAPLCLNSFGPREQTKKGLCPRRKRWCVTRGGDNASLAPSLSRLCVSDKPIVNSLSLRPRMSPRAAVGPSAPSADWSPLQHTVGFKFHFLKVNSNPSATCLWRECLLIKSADSGCMSSSRCTLTHLQVVVVRGLM